ncbi:hypothetical protein [Microbacter margulisiae]|uniref:Uncharacterized protein n=1 Tax=Microbacter margulisiae TaxID=1350067 RepID=A0A7W5H248_9PORP|nr:hypothetical protein [Microbacter margulisiae]MBB3187370.1 hypothetical protein [Microbacter margulisiae]
MSPPKASEEISDTSQNSFVTLLRCRKTDPGRLVKGYPPPEIIPVRLGFASARLGIVPARLENGVTPAENAVTRLAKVVTQAVIASARLEIVPARLENGVTPAKNAVTRLAKVVTQAVIASARLIISLARPEIRLVMVMKFIFMVIKFKVIIPTFIISGRKMNLFFAKQELLIRIGTAGFIMSRIIGVPQETVQKTV